MPALVGAFSKVGEELEKSLKEARELLKTLESGLDGKCCFGVTKIGYADVATAWIGCWVRMAEEILETKLIDKETMPVLAAWIDYVLQDPLIKDCMPPHDKLFQHMKDVRSRHI